MTPIPFRVNPAFVTLGDALELAVAHLRANLALWLVPTAIYTLVAGSVTWAVTDVVVGWLTPAMYGGGTYTAETGQQILETFRDNLPALVGFALLLVIGGVALYWIAMALAVGGLPGRRMTTDQAIGAGLRSIVFGILYFVVAVAATFALVAVGLLAGRAAAVLLLLLIPAAIAAFVYLAIRLSFALVAIFDGVGIVDSLRLSWAISRGGLLRIFGWLLAIFAISFGISIASSIASAPFVSFPLVGTLIATLMTTAFQFYQVTVLAILYESQRMRHVYATPGGAVLPGGPVRPATPSVDPAAPADPLLPPPPPAW